MSFVGVFARPDPARMLQAMGVEPAWHDDRVAFGGAESWTDPTSSLVVSGDIALDNEDDLRRALEQPEAPTPALVAELYRRHGPDLGVHLTGMFALAIWDREQQRLTLLRDAIGARTMYYVSNRDEWCFACRSRSLLRHPSVSRNVSLPALRLYLSTAFVPGELTMWRDVKELRPGTALTIPGGQRHAYWEPVEGTWDPAETLDDHAARLRPLIEDAVRVCLPTNRPVGVYLSGGVDSSLVTALTSRLTDGPVHTYAIHFGAGYPNELAFSDLVARHCGTHHHVLELPASLIEKHLVETMEELDDPIGDPLTVPNFLMGRAAAQHSNVILNGEGGDPCFGGPKNVPMLLHALYGSQESNETAYLRSYEDCYDDLPRLLSPEAHELLSKEPPVEKILAPFFTGTRMKHFLNRLMDINLQLKGADHILTKVSNLTQANALLGRSPLFDLRVVEASFAIPPPFKVAGSEEKLVLKRAVADLLPEVILNRPKSGMMVPVQAWFRKEMRPLVNLLLERDARTAPWLNRAVIEEWINYRGELWPRHGRKLWLVLSLEIWLRAHE